MSIGVTDERNVALFDTVTGRAFGITFQDEDEASSFLAYAGARGIDLRELSYEQIETLHGEFSHAYRNTQGEARPQATFIKHLPEDVQAAMRDYLRA